MSINTEINHYTETTPGEPVSPRITDPRIDQLRSLICWFEENSTGGIENVLYFETGEEEEEFEPGAPRLSSSGIPVHLSLDETDEEPGSTRDSIQVHLETDQEEEEPGAPPLGQSRIVPILSLEENLMDDVCYEGEGIPVIINTSD